LLKIIFYGNQQAGMVGLLTAIAVGCNIIEVWEDDGYGIPGINSLDLQRRLIRKNDKFVLPQDHSKLDLFLCVHGRQIIPEYILESFKEKGVNLHPFLNKYPGPAPVQRAICAGETVATVYAHRMTSKIDDGQILASASVKIPKFSETQVLRPVDVYNELYPLYAEVVARVLKNFKHRNVG